MPTQHTSDKVEGKKKKQAIDFEKSDAVEMRSRGQGAKERKWCFAEGDGSLAHSLTQHGERHGGSVEQSVGRAAFQMHRDAVVLLTTATKPVKQAERQHPVQ